MDPLLEKYLALLRSDFCAFNQRCFEHLNPSTQFLGNWHHEVLAAKLEACRQGKIRRLIINIPPRYLKSTFASVAFPAWVLGHDPAAQILCVSYAQPLADKLARDFRSAMNSRWYRSLFATRPLSAKQALHEFETGQHGYRFATSVGGVLTGRGADTIILDDPIKPEEAISESQRHAVNEWYSNTLYSRLNDKRRGCIIIIMQRLHLDDLVGHVLEQEPWEILRFPAIAEHDEEFIIETPFGGTRRFKRREGDVLHPERESLQTLEQIRKNLGEYNFASQYQQSPIPVGGGMVKAEWFQSYEFSELPKQFDQILQSWDTASKASELNDYSVCTTWGIKHGHLFLLHVLRERLEYPALKEAVREQTRLHRATVILIEDRASGTQLIQDLVNEGLSIVTGYSPEGDKIMRMRAQTSTIYNGFVHLPREASWLADYLREIATFPYSKDDDQVDSTSQALAWFNQTSQEPEFITYIRKNKALNLYREGVSIEEIAVRTQSSPARVQRWINEDKTRVVEEEERQKVFKMCAYCGKPIFYNISRYTSEEGNYYHEECHRKKMYGA